MAAAPAVSILLNENDPIGANGKPLQFVVKDVTPLGFTVRAFNRAALAPQLSGRVGWIATSVVPFPA
jgi:hypothetical protein